jgi:DNA-binding HxlR family transcriptional regulator
MRRKNPYYSQRQTKSLNRQKIINILKTKPSTFSELLKSSQLSRPILAQYLKELRSDKMIVRQIDENDNIAYELTQRGKALEVTKTRAFASGVRAATSLVATSKEAEIFSGLANMAKDNPEKFQIFMDWMLDFELFITSDPFYESKWLRILGGEKEAWRPFGDEIAKRMSGTVRADTSEELRATLNQISAIVKEMLEEEKAGKRA